MHKTIKRDSIKNLAYFFAFPKIRKDLLFIVCNAMPYFLSLMLPLKINLAS